MLSSSDAHSLHNLGRELNRFETDMIYDAIFEAIKTGIGFKGTFEAFPEKGNTRMMSTVIAKFVGRRLKHGCIKPFARHVGR